MERTRPWARATVQRPDPARLREIPADVRPTIFAAPAEVWAPLRGDDLPACRIAIGPPVLVRQLLGADMSVPCVRSQ